MTPYETLRAKRNEMFPPKLEFNCQVREGDGQLTYTVLYEWGNHYGNKFVRIINDETCFQKDIAPKDITAILGLPITLADVLRMLGNDGIYCVSSNGEVCERLSTGSHHRFHFNGEPIIIDPSLPVQDYPEATLQKILELIG